MSGWRIVQIGCINDQHTAQHELESDDKVKDKDGEHAGDDDGDGGGEPLENVVGILDNQSHQETTGGLREDDEIGEGSVAVKEAIFSQLVTIFGPDTKDETHDGTKQSQLNIAFP